MLYTCEVGLLATYWLQQIKSYTRGAQITDVMCSGRINCVRLRLIFVGPQCVIFLMSHLLAPRISRWILDFCKHSVLHAKKKCHVFLKLLHIQILLKHPVQFRAFMISLCSLHLREDMLRWTLQPVHCGRWATKLHSSDVRVRCNMSNKI
jgi:hypothetical protein